MERIIVLLLAGCLATVQAQNWRPIVPSAAITTNVVHRTPGSLYRYDLHEQDPDGPTSIGHEVNRDQCSIYKVVMTQRLYFEYIHYKTDMPDLKEFTLCMWHKFTNHSNDHPLFSYAVPDRARGILAWVSNTQRSSYFQLNIDGHNLYRLNYPLRLNRWYHSCQSWNGRTGEWQIWVNDERVGRGFNNRLVGHVIKGGGVAISGQEQRQLGGGFLEGEDAPPGSGGMLGELTMVQLYGIALTAGKAHRDHKHHHAHHFEHDTSNRNPPSTTTTPAPVTGPPLPMHPLLTGGQLNYQVKVNPGVHLQIRQNGVILRHPSLPPHPEMAPQPLPPQIFPEPSTIAPPVPSGSPSNLLQPTAISPFNFAQQLANIGSPRQSIIRFEDDGNQQQIQAQQQQQQLQPINGFSFVDRRYRNAATADRRSAKIPLRPRQLRLSDSSDDGSDLVQRIVENMELKKLAKRSATANHTEVADKVSFVESEASAEKTPSRKARSSLESTRVGSQKKTAKRGLVFADGSIVDDGYIQQSAQLLSDAGGRYLPIGLANFGLSPLNQQKQVGQGIEGEGLEQKEYEREPAEDEVRRVMNMCDGCAEEPFEKALVFGWRSVPKKLYSGALHVPAVQACKAF